MDSKCKRLHKCKINAILRFSQGCCYCLVIFALVVPVEIYGIEFSRRGNMERINIKSR